MTDKEKTQQWAFSSNGEDYWVLCDDRESALNEGALSAHDNEEDLFYIAPVTFSTVDDIAVNVDGDTLAEWNYDELPEDSEWPNATKEQDQDLQKSVAEVVRAWLVRHKLEPNWYMPGKVEEKMTMDHYESEAR